MMTSATGGRSTVSAQLHHRPAELFRADLISAMKLPDSVPMESGSFLTIRDQWRTEWEVGVQVCVSPENIPGIQPRPISDPPQYSEDFRIPPTRLTEDNTDPQYVQYDVDDLDLNWLECVNQKRKFRALAGPGGLSEVTLREAILTLETKCQQNMARAVAVDTNLGIEYDEHTVCDVCKDHESEETNDMVFCDVCNVCVHQACYGVLSIPKGHWVCKVCAAKDTEATCALCPNTGGAMKRVRPGNNQWAHLSCALWIPEVRVGNVERMEPISNIDGMPMSRRNLVCSLCRKKQGACIQCNHPSCAMSFHVTCAFEHGLEMQSRLDMSSTGVIHESFCQKHTMMRRSPLRLNSPSHRNHISRPTQLLQVREAFHKYASPDDLVQELKLSSKLSLLLFNYWKLKRRSLHNRPLLSHLPIETAIESIKAELALGAQFGLTSDQTFLKIIHLRQNLEKARNLVYMSQRRERLKKHLIQTVEQIFDVECQLMLEAEQEGEEEEEEGEGVPNKDTRLDSEVDGEEDELQCVRQTRSMTQLQRCEPLASVDGEGVDGEGVADSLSIRHTRSMSQVLACTNDCLSLRTNSVQQASTSSLPSATCNRTGSHFPTSPVNGPHNPREFNSETVNSSRGRVTSTSSSLSAPGRPHCPSQRSRKRSRDALSPSSESQTLEDHQHSFDTTHLVRKKIRSGTDADGDFSESNHIDGNGEGGTFAALGEDGPALNLRCRASSLNKAVKS